MNSAQVCVFEETYHICFCSLLQSKDCLWLEPEVRLVLLGDFSDKSLEWKFTYEELGTLLELSDFSQCNCTWSESVNSFDATSSWLTYGVSSFSCCLIGQLLSWSFGSGVFSSCLFAQVRKNIPIMCETCVGQGFYNLYSWCCDCFSYFSARRPDLSML